MKKAFITSCFLLTFMLVRLSAQHESAPNAFAFRWTWNNFQYPLTQKLDRFDYTTGVELTYVRHLGKMLNLAVPLKFGKASLPLDDNGTVRNAELIGSLDAVLQLKFTKPESKLYPYLLAGAGLMTETENDWAMNPEFPVGLGLNIKLFPNLYLSAETQYRLDLNDNRNQLQHALGIWMVLGGNSEEKKDNDKDKDGITDKEDQCPDEPGTAALMGCPDNDGDGVANKLDQCPEEAGKPSLAGCPDSDDDGVANRQDRCPDAPGTSANQGCPDSDSDGIIDPDDRCPETAGTASNKGCPELKPEEKELLEFAKKAVQFETGSAKLLSSSFETLDEIAQIMRNNPGQKLRISGHTDSIGEVDENQVLSERRAKTCYDYLVSKGIKAARISFAGYGESKPIADNLYAPGREKNRRVEFEMYVD